MEKKVDTKPISEYLKGEGKIKVIKNAINNDNIKDIGKIEKGPKIVYVIKNDKLLIEKK